MFRKTLLSVFLIAGALLAPAAALHAQTCATSTLPIDKRNEMFKTNVNVPIWFDDPVMFQTCQSEFQQVLNNWQSSAANAEFNVTFSFTTDGNAPGSVRVVHSPPSNAANPGSFVAFREQYPETFGPGLQDARLHLNPALQGCGALAGTFAHEIGHGFGLADCYGTACSNTVMQQHQGEWNWAGPMGPTNCDVNGIQHWLDPLLRYEKGDASCYKVCPFGQVLDPAGCFCHVEAKEPVDPLLIDVDGDGVQLTSVADGVLFDFEGNGAHRRTAWTRRGGDDGWLALDRNGNGRIDDGSELFGNLTPQPASAEPQGFAALAVYDQLREGGNGDGALTPADAIFASLVVWQDRDHDGVAAADEVQSLSAAGITSIELQPRTAGRRDAYGNYLRYRGKVVSDRHAGRGHWAYDVFVQTAQP